ncbi:DUF3231 family protein [Desulfolucanica intricata]|uniref:DUF3231 family protein n=1 Tax=Desulfolucanica intricata TaxID=1285191 RepID=UPI0008313942|nr:DUF3231 family protein [Desulfolucanica intricata]
MLSLFKKKEKQVVSVREAFDLWDILKMMYSATERFNTYKNDAHDKDLKVLIDLILNPMKKQIETLENELLKYSIPAPDRNSKAINFPNNSQAITDEFIAGELFICIQEKTENLLRAFRTSITNDSVRALFENIALDSINKTDKIIQYLKLKGWIDTPPLYNNIPPNITEKVATMEIANLWDHLTFRYDNRNTTEILHSYANDQDFKLTLDLGLRTLEEQIKILEKEVDYFGIPLPKRPGKITMKPEKTEILHDDHMFRTLLAGLQGATIMHAQTLKECTFNNRIRKIFKVLLEEELNLLDKYFKFGKLKGWFHPTPQYGS